jgi:RNA polymerase sigma-70 factor (ECF subfamily)
MGVGMRTDDFLEATLGSMDLVYNLARRLARDERGAEDLVQETYLRAFEAWRKNRKPDRVEPWLVTICLNVARSDARRRRRRPDELLLAEMPDAASSGVDVARDALDAVDRTAVRRALWELPEQQRIAIALVDICGMTTDQAARAARAPRGTILSRVHRGRKTLAQLLRAEVEDREP